MLVLNKLRRYITTHTHNKKDNLFVWKINRYDAMYSRYLSHTKYLDQCTVITFIKFKICYMRLEIYDDHIPQHNQNIILRKNKTITYEIILNYDSSTYYVDVIDSREGNM